MRVRAIMWSATLAGALLYAFWSAADREVGPLTAAERAKLGGTYVQLPQGVTHFKLSGPKDGPLIVLVHGGTMGLYVWDDQARALQEAGFRVLRYDAFGRGRSDRPDVDYTLDLAVDQLGQMIRLFANDRPVHLAGVSLGGLVAAAYAASDPHRVERLTLISPVVRGVPSTRGFWRELAQVPGLGEYAMRVVGMKRLVARAESFLDALPDDKAYFADRFREQMRYGGFERAMLSTLRGDILNDQRAVYTALGKSDVPTELIWGTEDEEISEEDVNHIRRSVPGLVFIPARSADHALLLRKEDMVSHALVGFHNVQATDRADAVAED